ncbi:MAG: hypothetical protein K8R41_06700 [Bacteroidales bacterium]|nr:hypothetical protein [Bacteroidales bacterium]
MKKVKSLLMFTVFVCIVFSANSQNIKDIFETTWKGGSKSLSDFTQSGYTQSIEKMYDVYFNENTNTFTAKILTTFSLDGKSYKHKSKYKGRYYPSTNEVTLKHDYTIEYDFLPNNWRWVITDMDLTIGTDGDHEGYYFMKGQTSKQSNSEEFYLLCNYPYY